VRNYSGGEVADYVREGASRRDGESADDYYSRFALVYQQVAFMVNKPIAVIAQALGHDTNTIHQYIHRARQRGYLPHTKRGTT
jgi:hypothetical protein